ncbi:MAG: hypothetical protein IT380_19095 [Myxococcales bacterium]|nr:hypothetical protein [Myxococcales bacterium]
MTKADGSEPMPPASSDASFVAQCVADYTCAEITAIGHSDPEKKLTVLLAVVELLHPELEANPMVGTKYYARRQQLSDRAGTLLVQRWHLSVAEGLQWYRANASGAMLVRGTPTPIPLGTLGDDPPWPHCVAEVRSFWRKSEFWGARPGGSRWHRMIPHVPVDVTAGWNAADFEKAREWLLAETHIDLFSRSVLLGSCHLRLPNPVYQCEFRKV